MPHRQQGHRVHGHISWHEICEAFRVPFVEKRMQKYAAIYTPEILPPGADALPDAQSHAAPVVIVVPGLNGSPYEHWQSVWERERDDCIRAELGHWHDPTPRAWLSRLHESIINAERPVVLAAHSLGCLATALWLQKHPIAARSRVLGALLVAPCDPGCGRSASILQRFDVVRQHLPVRTITVASGDDPYADLGWSKQLAADWGGTFINAGRAGHINADSNLGSWVYGQILLDLLRNGSIS
jgi:predicted alpha/beta hydrolase family esterase